MSREYGRRRAFASVHSVVRGGSTPCRWEPRSRFLWESPVHDVLFLLLIAALFGLLALCAKGAEKL